MKRLLFGALAACLAAGAADADSICAAPQEIKVLQAAALQQQLMAAALTCHDAGDYNRFVAAFRTQIMQSDRALKQFFERHRNSEGYNAYKTRIANEASLKSLKDPRFCESARMVFDSAFRNDAEIRPGLAPEPPSLIDTGYEFCRALPPKPQVASNVPPHSAKLAPVAKPTPAALQLVQPPRAAPTAHVEIAALDPVRKTAKPNAVSARPAAPVKVASLPRARTASPVAAAPAPAAAPVAEDEGEADEVSSDEADREARGDVGPSVPEYSIPPRRQTNPNNVAGQNGRPGERFAGRNIPNAYLPGAEWVHDEPAPPPPRWVVRYGPPPPWAYHRPHPRWVMGPDGRWYLVAPYRSVWTRD